MQESYCLRVAGVERQLPICKISEELAIAAFVVLGDAELTEACARALLQLVNPADYDYMLSAEAKGIPLIHEMARQSGVGIYLLARKGVKAYMRNPLRVEDQSITTAGQQALYLDGKDAELVHGKRILVVDDVISTGGSLRAMETLIEAAGGTVVDRVAILAEGDAINRTDIKFLEALPLFRGDGTRIA